MRKSLSFRLFLAAGLATLLALVATAIAFNFLFRLYFEDRLRNELEVYLILLTGNVRVNYLDEPNVTPISDPRFEQALSGYYWQVQIDEDEPILSPSLWAAPLPLNRPETPGLISFSDVTIGADETVAVASWVVTVGEADERREIFLAIAIDRADLDASALAFLRNSLVWLLTLGLFLIAASWLQVRLGLRPLKKIRSELSRVGKTPNARLSHDYPTEVLPLAEEVNQLLDANADALERARSSAGNLAHGLKTPLTILFGLVRKVRNSAGEKLTDELVLELTNIEHIVERELAASRDSQQLLRKCEARPIALRLHGALFQKPGFEHIRWDIDVPKSLYFPFDEFDMTELLGNLLDNAMKWTATRIVLRGWSESTGVFLSVEDDGPGIPGVQRSSALERGKRLDAIKSGSGLGLNISERMAKAHGCELSLHRSSLGGLGVCLAWFSASN